MVKFLETLKITYLKKMISKSFLITTSILILIIIGVSNYDRITNFFDNEPKKIAILSDNEQLITYLDTNKKLIDEDIKFIKKSNKNATIKMLKDKKIYKIYEVNESKDGLFSTKIYSSNNVSQNEVNILENILTTFQISSIQQNLKLNDKQIQLLNSKSEISVHQISNKNTTEKYSDQENAFLILFSYVIVVIMIFIILNYANQIALEIAAEKTSRVIEMIITSVSPSSHLISKILAIILVALTQMLILFVTIVICIKTVDYNEVFKKMGIEFNPDFWPIILSGILLFILGIISYVVLAAILGSLTSRIEDLTQSLIPVSILGLAAFYISFLNIENADSLLVKITSYIPFLSPFVLLIRLINQNVNNVEFIIIVSINVLAIITMIIIAAFTYKNSVLSFEKSIFKTLKKQI